MGAWGAAIFSDDLAADVHDEFTDLIAQGLSSTAAMNHLVSEYEELLDDPDDSVVFWLALAATQHQLGRLTDRQRKRGGNSPLTVVSRKSHFDTTSLHGMFRQRAISLRMSCVNSA
jgi:hypothetical protein